MSPRIEIAATVAIKPKIATLTAISPKRESC